MHPRILDQRNGEADTRISEAAATLAEQHGLEPELVAGLAVYDRDPAARAMLRREAVANLLEALADRADPATGADLEALSVPDLKDLAEQRGVVLEGRMKKADIIAALESHTQAGGTVPVPEATEENAPPPDRIPLKEGGQGSDAPPVSTHPAGDVPPASSGAVKE